MTFDRRKVVRDAAQKHFTERVFFGFDFLEELKQHIRDKKPFVFLDHAYFDRGYEAGNFRCIRNGIHQRELKDRPSRRVAKPAKWREGSHILIFPPSKTIAQTFDAQSWVDETVRELLKHTDREIFIKGKQDGPLERFLDDCHAVVGYGTVASVEAVLAGVPAFCGPNCPATAVGLPDLSQIESPRYPDREAWINTLAWSQVSRDEIDSGFIKEICGP